MINQYNIHNFKIHGDTELRLAGLTILTGMNGMGKSSVMQTMLLLRNSFLKHDLPRRLNLKGEPFEIGGSAGLVNANVEKEPDVLRLSMECTQEGAYCFEFNYPIGNDTRLNGLPSAIQYTEEEMGRLSLFNHRFQYLSAFRDGPQSMYGADTRVVDDEKQLSYRKGCGEFTIYYLNRYGDMDIPVRELAYDPQQTDLSLRAQVEAWLTEISPNIKINIEQQAANFILKYGYRQEGRPIKWVEALNSGFGITYVLSVLVAILSAEPDSLILVENPEAHIHPAAQAALMRLITKAAGHGVQVVLETHSDHIINGALVGAKKNWIDQNDLSIYFFQRNRETMNAEALQLEIGESGRIQNAPSGFFDQMRLDFETLFDIETETDVE